MVKVELYYQTGFNSRNIPDNVEILRRYDNSKKEYTDVDLIQTEYLTEITLDDLPMSWARGVDYIVVQDQDTGLMSCYTVTSHEWRANGICKFYIQLDAWCTMGGVKPESPNEILAANVNRMHVTAEEDNKNIFDLDEPFQPSLRCDTEIIEITYPEHGQRKQFLETFTVPPRLIEGRYKAALFAKDATGDVVLAIPEPRNSASITEVQLNGPDGLRETIKTNTYYWDADKEKVIRDLRLSGRDNDIINLWEVPTGYIDEMGSGHNDYGYSAEREDGANFGIRNIKSRIIPNSVPINDPVARGRINQKIRYSQSYTLTLFCPASGDSSTVKVSDVMDEIQNLSSQSIKVSYVVAADIRPGGAPLAWWKRWNGADATNLMMGVVKGAEWRNLSLATSGPTIDQINKIKDVKDSREKNQSIMGYLGAAGVGAVAGAMKGAAMGSAAPGVGNVLGGVIGGVLGGIGGAAIKAFTSYKNDEKLEQQQNILQSQAVRASAPLLIGTSAFARDSGRNGFSLMVASYAQKDLEAYDTFLTRFGYNVGNKDITWRDFYSRENYNFIRANYIQFKSRTGGNNAHLYDLVEQQLQEGVRIWHTAPQAAHLQSGGNPAKW